MSARSEQVTYILNLRDRVTRGLKVMRTNFAKTDRSADMFGRTLKRVGGDMLTAFSVRQITRWGQESMKAWDIQDKAIKQVQKGLISTEYISGKTLKGLQSQASQLQKKTLFGDEKILADVSSQLTTFTNIANKEFDRTQMAALDLSTRVGQDLKSSTIQLGKALNDPVANLGALSRSGIQFTKDQKLMIKSLWETGQQAKAQSLILDELEKQYGGSAEAAAKAGTGGFTQLRNAFGDIQEMVGKTLTKSFMKALPRMQKFTEHLGKVMPKHLESLGRGLDFLIRNFDTIMRVVKVATKIFVGYKATMIALRIATKAMVVSNKILRISYVVLSRGIKGASRAMKGFRTSLMTTGVGALVVAIGFAIEGLISWIDKTKEQRKEQEKLNKTLYETQDITGRAEYQKFLKDIGASTQFEEITDPKTGLPVLVPKIKEASEVIKKLQANINKLSETGLRNIYQFISESLIAAKSEGKNASKLIEAERQRNIRDWTAQLKIIENRIRKIDKVRQKIQPKTTYPGTQIEKQTKIDKKAEKQISTITGAAPKTFNINVQNLVEEFNVNTENITEGAGEVRRMISMALAEALADVQPIRD